MEFNITSLIAVFAAALAGSFHCTTMCGGISLSVTQGKFSNQFSYHGSRLIGYLALGSLAGVLGQHFVFGDYLQRMGVLLGWSLGITLFIAGIMMLFNKSIQYQNKISSKIATYLMKIGFEMTPAFRSSLVGLASVFLPCGWLYTFVLLSLATHSLIGATLTLLVFWMGTLPALIGGQLFLRQLLQKLEFSGKKMVAVLMMLAGIASVHSHFQHPVDFSKNDKVESMPMCH